MSRVRAVLRLCGGVGLLILLPMLFLEERIGLDAPPAITHPEYFYGFIVVTVAFQLIFLTVASDPVKYRPLFWAMFVEKFGWVAVLTALFLRGRVPNAVIPFGVMDGLMGLALIWCYRKTGASKGV